MKMLKLKLVAVLFFGALAVILRAQDTCSPILDHGIYDKFQITNFSSLKEIYREALSLSYEQFITQYEQNKSKFQAVYEAIYVGYDKSAEKSRFETLKLQYNQNTESFFDSVQFQKVLVETINQSVVDAWRDCVSNRVIIGYFTGDASDIFTAFVQYKPASTGDGRRRVTGINYNYATPLSSPDNPGVAVGTYLNPFATISQKFRRINPNRPDTITITFNTGDPAQIRLPAIESPEVKELKQKIKELTADVAAVKTSQATLASTVMTSLAKVASFKHVTGTTDGYGGFHIDHGLAPAEYARVVGFTVEIQATDGTWYRQYRGLMDQRFWTSATQVHGIINEGNFFTRPVRATFFLAP